MEHIFKTTGAKDLKFGTQLHLRKPSRRIFRTWTLPTSHDHLVFAEWCLMN